MSKAGLKVLTVAALFARVYAEPVVRNPSFESDAYDTWPGYARMHGDRLTGWSFSGGIGINPLRGSRGANPGGGEDSAFFDNDRAAHGRQVCFLQNAACLRQRVGSFEKGRSYQVIFFENARHNKAPERNPKLTVTLGGERLVYGHTVKPVEAFGRHDLPFCRVESAPFRAPHDGAFELVFETTVNDRVAVLLDHIQIRPIP